VKDGDTQGTKGKRFKRFEILTPSAELKPEIFAIHKKFVCDKNLYKLGKML
jgi:hypothetical protein